MSTARSKCSSEAAAANPQAPIEAVAIISYDEKPGMQAIGTTAPDLPPAPGRHAGFGRDHEYVRHGTISLLAGIDLLTGKVHASVEDRHRSREFVAFLKRLDAAYPPSTAITLILDNHSAHISKETRGWLADQREGRFSFVFTPKHGSWLNLIEVAPPSPAGGSLRSYSGCAARIPLTSISAVACGDVGKAQVLHIKAGRPR